MTMTMDASQQRFGQPMGFDYGNPGQSPAFTNPWTSTSAPQHQQHPQAPPSAHPSHDAMYVGSQHYSQPPLGHGLMAPKPPSQRPQEALAHSVPSYGPIAVPGTNPGLMSQARVQAPAGYTDPAYASGPSPVNGHLAAASSAPYDSMGYAPAGVRLPPYLPPNQDVSRRYSQSSMQSDDRKSFADALDASHGMLAMSQETPRNIYGNRNDRSSVDSYGFPSTHSTSSSISSSGNFSSYYQDSVSDYSTAGSDIESVNSRTLPRPQGVVGSQLPPAPQSMMGQFSSKVSCSTQKKHKCKVCDKRFTRPSSLQTHMYSHTGEKPFACKAEGCGRHFSVVSNLRRHQRVHQGGAPSEAGSEDQHSE